MNSFQVIPVLDLQAGIVVRGIAGRRSEYKPLETPLACTARPLDVAEGIVKHYGLREFYVADLDAITGQGSNDQALEALVSAGFHIWLDAGIREMTDALRRSQRGLAKVVLGLETITAQRSHNPILPLSRFGGEGRGEGIKLQGQDQTILQESLSPSPPKRGRGGQSSQAAKLLSDGSTGPYLLEEACQVLGADRLIFSLDLKGGELLGNRFAWPVWEPLEVAKTAWKCGIRQMIVLDLAQVGMQGGTGTEGLCEAILKALPGVELFAGGGVRDEADLRRLAMLGLRGALVASALHEGRLCGLSSPADGLV